METIPGLPELRETLKRDGVVVVPGLRIYPEPNRRKKKLSLPFKTKHQIEHEGWKEFVPLIPFDGITQTDSEYIVTAPTEKTHPLGSQLWHRDNSSHPWAYRVIVYQNDVDLTNGPFCYAPGTQKGGWRYPNTFLRMSDEQFSEYVPESDWKIFTGPAGTTIIANIVGYHKGLMNVSGSRACFAFSYYTLPYRPL